jgi:adenylate cyclase
MFVDLRESSRLGEQRMPYDVFFILDRFFAELAEALHETGGYYSTFSGDGLMALYGTTTDVRRRSRARCAGQSRLSSALPGSTQHWRPTSASRCRRGSASMGATRSSARWGRLRRRCFPRSAVNVAARLEEETKQHRCVLVVSAACAEAGEVDLSTFRRHTSSVRGCSEPVTYDAIREPHQLAGVLAQ